jgi:hypothetical protein
MTDIPTRVLNGVTVPLTEAEIAARAADEAAAAAAPAPDRLIAKTRIYSRATDPELATLEAYLTSTASVRQRLMWQDAADGLVWVSEVLPFAQALFGNARAAELLARG